MEPTENFNNYGSHLQVFEKIFANYDVENVLEFGMGIFSTKYLAGHAKRMFSVEQESREWYEKVISEVKSSLNWKYIFQFDPCPVFAFFDSKGIKFDLVFSDGACSTRCQVANLAMERNVPLVVLHDAEKVWYYQWNKLEIPQGYRRFNFCSRQGNRKVTTILANNDTSVIDKLEVPEHDKVILTYSEPNQPVDLFICDGIEMKPDSSKEFASLFLSYISLQSAEISQKVS